MLRVTLPFSNALLLLQDLHVGAPSSQSGLLGGVPRALPHDAWVPTTPAREPPTAPYREGDGCDVIVDGARFLPYNCTVVKVRIVNFLLCLSIVLGVFNFVLLGC